MSAPATPDDGAGRLAEIGRLRAENAWLRADLRSETERVAVEDRVDELRAERARLRARVHQLEDAALDAEIARIEADSTARLPPRRTARGEATAAAPHAAPPGARATVGGTALADVERVAALAPSRSEALAALPIPLALPARGIPSLPVPDGPVARPDVRVAAVMDEFTRLAFQYECALTNLELDRWEDQLRELAPQVLIVESVWRGAHDAWRHRLSTTRFDDAQRLLAAARKAGIPTVFWNKEDPANFEHFAHNAPWFDHILTTDAACVERYRDLVGHDRVGVLPFAAQPRIHNPVRMPGGRALDVAFAGTYYRNKHPDRRVQMAAVLDPARRFGLDIFSRVPDHDAYRFPPEYEPHIVGTLAYPDLLSAHKLYRAFINVNSVIGSTSMCARRIFELLASGASVVSGVSPAITALLGEDLVWESEDPERTAGILGTVLADDDERDLRAVVGLREVMRSHTYAHRLDQVLDAVGVSAPRATPTVSAVALLETPEDAEAVRAALRSQSTAPIELLAVVDDRAAAAPLEGLPFPVRVVEVAAGASRGRRLQAATRAAGATHVAYLEPRDFYGRHFLEDALAAFAYTDADLVGKALVFDRRQGTLTVRRVSGHEYDEVPVLHEATVVARRASVADAPWRDCDDGPLFWLTQDARRAGRRLFSTDRFNFAANADRQGHLAGHREDRRGLPL